MSYHFSSLLEDQERAHLKILGWPQPCLCVLVSILIVFGRTWQGLFQSAANGRCPTLCRARKGQEKVASRAAKAQRTCTTYAGTHYTYICHTNLRSFFALFRVQEIRHDKTLPEPRPLAWFGHVMYKKGMWSIKDASCIFV